MPVVKSKPTSPGRRFVVKVVHPDLHKGAPYKGLIEAKSKSGGRNNAGRITTRHVGGGHKQKYRVIDFRRNDKDGVKATVERLEYDPNRTANIALLKYSDGERRYVIAPKNLAAGDVVQAGENSPIRVGNCMPLRNIPMGSVIHCVELDAVNNATHRDISKRHAIANADRGIFSCLNHISCCKILGRNHVPTFTIAILQQCDVGCSIWIIFQPLDGRFYAVFIVATEVDDSILLFVATADVTCRDSTRIIPSA